jgi:hypothetical protein
MKRKLSDVSNVVRKISSKKEIMEQKYRASLIGNDYSMVLGMPKVNTVYRSLSFTSTEW